MEAQDDDFLKKLLSAFKIEAQEHITIISNGLLELEKAPASSGAKTIIENIHREVHSLKGAARAVNLTAIEVFCRQLEELFLKWKQGDLQLTADQFDAIHKIMDEIGQTLAVEFTTPDAPLPVIESVRMPVSRLTELLLQTEELITAKLLLNQRLSDLHELGEQVLQWKNEGTALGDEKIKLLLGKINEITKFSAQDSHFLDVRVNNLLESSKKLLMMPFASLLNFFPKMVRDLARSQGKDIHLNIEGGAIEIDKRILEAIKDALVHIVRNAIDHGIEMPAERKAQNKPLQGSIEIKIIQQNSSEVELMIRDDGRGINTKALKEAAIEQGRMLASDVKHLSEEQLFALMYQSGLSTKAKSESSDDLSGQGLGMSIVKETVEKLSGQIFIESQPSRGTQLHITLPVTLATFKGVLCEVAGQTYVMPMSSIERVLRVHRDGIKTVGLQATIDLAGQVVVVLSLAQALNLERTDQQADPYLHLVVVHCGEKLIALVVDHVFKEIEVLIKHLTGLAETVKMVTGVAVLGSGQVVPILNIPEIGKILLSQERSFSTKLEKNDQSPERDKSVLLADDSITTRLLLKNILETAGFRVTTAVDGLDAWGKIKLHAFDLIVTDLEMPNMDGFKLIEQIRSDKKLTNLPVVIVSTRESQQDRLRGIDVGADAYVIKRGLNDHDLIDVIHQLI